MEAEAGISGQGDCRPSDSSLRGQGLLGYCCPAALIELETKRFTEGRQRPLGGIGFCDLEGDIVHFAWCRSASFSGAVAFPNDGRAVRMYGDAHTGGVDRQESS